MLDLEAVKARYLNHYRCDAIKRLCIDEIHRMTVDIDALIAEVEELRAEVQGQIGCCAECYDTAKYRCREIHCPCHRNDVE